MAMSPVGLGPENDCAGEAQQQLLHKDYDRKCSVEKKILALSLKGLVAKTN
jgi:hypothetical protein